MTCRPHKTKNATLETDSKHGVQNSLVCQTDNTLTKVALDSSAVCFFHSYNNKENFWPPENMNHKI